MERWCAGIRAVRVWPPGAPARAERSDRGAQRFFGGRAAVARRLETLMLEGLFQRFQDEQHVLGGRAVTHQTDAEDLARERPETAGDLDAALLEQEFPHFGVVHALRHLRRVERP